MDRKFLFQCIIAASLTAAACGEEEDDGDTTLTDAAVSDAGGTLGDAGATDAAQVGSCDGLTYASFAQPLLMRNCTVCHGATPAGNTTRLDTVENVRAQKVHIIDHAVEPRMEPKMPQGLPALSADDQAKLKKWLNCGAP